MTKHSNETKKKFYLPANVFFDEMVRCLQDGKISDTLGRMFMLLAEKHAMHRNFIRYTHLREEIIGESIVACVYAFPRFNPYRKEYEKEHGKWDGSDLDYHHTKHHNPHTFFTTSIRNHLFNYVMKEYDQSNVTNAIKVQHGMDPSHGYEDAMKAKEQKKIDKKAAAK